MKFRFRAFAEHVGLQGLDDCHYDFETLFRCIYVYVYIHIDIYKYLSIYTHIYICIHIRIFGGM